MKYLICFRGADHHHDALKEGIGPSGGKKGPLIFDGGIDTTTGIPLSPLLPVAANFPHPDSKDMSKTTIDIILIPLPENTEDTIFTSVVDILKNKEEKKLVGHRISLQAESPFTNTSSIQKLLSIGFLKADAKQMMETVADDLSGMVWSHELAVSSVPKENVVATLKCTRYHGSFMLTDIQWQDESVVNKDFIELGFKEKLSLYLAQYLYKTHPLAGSRTELNAYRLYVREEDDFTSLHADKTFQRYYEQVQQFCDEEKIEFTHEDNIELIERYLENNKMDINDFCNELKEKYAEKRTSEFKYFPDKTLHSDIGYQSCLEEVTRFASKHKFEFTDPDNQLLMSRYKDEKFNIEDFCYELKWLDCLNKTKYFCANQHIKLTDEISTFLKGRYKDEKFDIQDFCHEIKWHDCLTKITLFCAEEKIDFTDQIKNSLMTRYKDERFDIDDFCEKLKNKDEDKNINRYPH